MRVVEKTHPNVVVRTYFLDKVLSDVTYMSKFDRKKLPADDKLGMLFDKFDELPLVTEVNFSKYQISISVVEAFAKENKTWHPIQNAMELDLLPKYFEENVDFYSALEKRIEEDRIRKEAEEARVKELGAILHAAATKFIPHDFETHRLSWRKAIEDRLMMAKVDPEYFDDPAKKEEVPSQESTMEVDANVTYWEHELKVFDEAFDQLFALKLPQN